MTTIKERPGITEPARGRGLRGARRRKLLGMSLALALSAGSIYLAGLFSRPPPQSSGLPQGISVPAENRISVASGAPQWRVLKTGEARPASQSWTDWVPARVRIDEARASKVGTPLGGRISSVLVELGQQVKTGDPLFSVASHEIAGLKAEKEKASVDLEAARVVLERVKAMVAEHALPAKEELTALQQFRQAEVAMKLSVSKLESLKVTSSRDNEFTVASPRDGVVVEKNVYSSQEVSSDTAGPLMVIADLTEVWVVAEIFEADVGDLREGVPARVTSPSFPGLTLEAKVDMVSSVVDPVRHTLPVRVSLPNAQHILRPNLYTQVRFSLAAKQGSVEVAASALVSDGTHQYVYVQGDPGDFTRREVIAASARDGKVGILSGLSPGEVVVEEGAILLDNQIALLH
jgi:cobalt-zinc-cadmium efflux system membrane fusion protein